MARLLPHAPEELTRQTLRRLGEGIGKEVFASDHWVVKRERSPREVVALILVWKFLRKWTRHLPSRAIRALRVTTQALIVVVPKRLWYSDHVAELLHNHLERDFQGERLARLHLLGTPLIPEIVTFPAATVHVSGWPGWLVVREATERVEATLDQHLNNLAEAGDFAAVEYWLNRFLETRRSGWQLGLFSTDAHLKNYGVIGDRVVLLDTGGLTNRWSDVAERLDRDVAVEEPHTKLGLARALASVPDLAHRFNQQWKATVNHTSVEQYWPDL